MSVLIQRLWDTPLSTCGMLSVDAVFCCYTLEPPAGKRVPPGTYKAKILASPKFSAMFGYQFFVPRLLGVPGWPDLEIEIHIGNYPDNTEGCTLVGQSHATDFVGNSREAFAELMAKLPQEFEVTYQDPPAVESSAG
jgi:Family of unknown function (DUF5675)